MRKVTLLPAKAKAALKPEPRRPAPPRPNVSAAAAGGRKAASAFQEEGRQHQRKSKAAGPSKANLQAQDVPSTPPAPPSKPSVGPSTKPSSKPSSKSSSSNDPAIIDVDKDTAEEEEVGGVAEFIYN